MQITDLHKIYMLHGLQENPINIKGNTNSEGQPENLLKIFKVYSKYRKHFLYKKYNITENTKILRKRPKQKVLNLKKVVEIMILYNYFGFLQ